MNIQKIVTLINLILIALIAYVGVGLFYQVTGIQAYAYREPAPEAAAPAPQAALKDHPMAYYRPVLERDLFNTKSSAPTQPQTSALDLDAMEETKLTLKLWGTVSGDPQTAYAVIEDTQKREQNLYRIGDAVQDATLKAILREKVILSVNGKDEILAMEEPQEGTGRIASSAARAGGRASFSPQAAINRTQRISLNRSMIDQAMQDVSKLMTEIVIRPHLEDGQPAGLSLNNIKPNSIFRRMGLRNGDVLVGVDGQAISSVDDALRLYENLKSSDGVKVQIKRRGQERTIDYNIR